MTPINPHRLETSPEARQPVLLLLGVACILLSVAAAGVLAWSHFTGIAAPGCGPGSACDKAARSLWSVVGVAYFLAVLVGWLTARGEADTTFKWIIRLGLLISLALMGVMLATKLWCKYCVAVHVGNLGFWLVAEMSRPRLANGLKPAVIVAGTFIVAAAGLGGVELATRNRVARQRAAEFDTTTQQIIDKSTATQPGATAPAGSANLHTPAGGFTGRYRLGPENAPIRIVIFSDYQCPDCRPIDEQLRTVLQQYKNVSISAKHYPMCTDCNVHMGKYNMHPNACWGARAAEAAGALRGNDGFWQMHHWLFDRKGSFTNDQMNAQLSQWGWDVAEFTRLINSEQILDLVKKDIEEGMVLGLHFTPMIFINGVELRGFLRNPSALPSAVARVVSANPQPGSPLQDQPPLAIEKSIGDWRAQAVGQLPPAPEAWSTGPKDARLKIVVFSDAQFKMTAELDQIIRQAMADRGDINYTFRAFPIDNACNPHSSVKRPSPACWVAAAGEAAGMLGGEEGYWKVHDWILANQSQLNDEALRQAAPGLGLDPEALLDTMTSQAVKDAIRREVDAARSFVFGVPSIYINGQWVPRWKIGETPIVRMVIEEAGR